MAKFVPNIFTRKLESSDLAPPRDVIDCFRRFSDGESHLSADKFRRFLSVHQCDVPVSVSDADRIIELVVHRRHHLTHIARHNHLGLDDFFFYLFSDDLNGPIKTQVHHDMSAPLSHYFIYTGHNSYLTGNQLSGDCSDSMIIKSLEMGVRVIELDLWPNSAKDGIHVLHGRTLTTPISLMKCLQSIKKHAFVSSEYPLVITLEDHLTSNLQAKVAAMLMEAFGEMLYYPESGCFKELPSPESLKRRIIISTKPPAEYIDSKRDDVGCTSPRGRDSFGKQLSATMARTSTMARSSTVTRSFRAKLPAVDDRSDSDDGDYSNSTEFKSGHHHGLEYKHLIGIHAGKPKNGLVDALTSSGDKVRRLSLSEQQLEKAAMFNGTDIVRFTEKNILRIYPKGTRIQSSNYNPLIGWMHGAQMVAFNMQGHGKYLSLMHGMFRANGGCGYVKKPDFLTKRGPCNGVFDPRSTLVVTRTLKVRIYMGDGWHLDYSATHFDKFSPPDFYVKMSIIGVAADNATKKTKVDEDNWCPVWNEEFTFPLTIPELALLRIEVKEHDNTEKDDFAGQTCLPVSELRQGIRAVPLFDKKGEGLKSVKLLMFFDSVDI